MPTLSPIVREILEGTQKKVASLEGQTVSVTQVASSVGEMYERLRNVIDYKDEHLLRRNAIERILKRKFLFIHSDNSGEGLIKELVWARYLKNDSVDLKTVKHVADIIAKYAKLSEVQVESVSSEEIKDWIVGVMSAEIDETLVSQTVEEALNRAMFRFMEAKLKLQEGLLTKDREVQVFLGVRRSLFKEDFPTMRYHLLLTYVTEWTMASDSIVKKLAENFSKLYHEIESQIHNPINTRLAKFLQPFTPPFLILKDLIEKSDNLEGLLNDPDEFEYSIEKICEKRYISVRGKLGRSIFRTTIYIFLTKMLLAYLLEMPADLYLYGKVHLLPLGINVVFPPVLMYAIGSSIKAPGRENTKRIKDLIFEIVYDTSSSSVLVPERFEVKNPRLGKFFAFIYLITFAVSFGVMIYFLDRFKFGIVSGGLFLFFLSVVSFFAYRIRLNAREYMAIGQSHGLVAGLIDIFAVPFLQMGHWISSRFAKINIFLFMFDFIIEAPFKAFVEVAEEWIWFLKQKKEEIA